MEPSDFADQMKALAEEAQKHLPQAQRTVPGPPQSPPPDPPEPVEVADQAQRKAPPSLLQMLRPLVLGLEALSRATVENTMVLARLEAASTNQDALPRIVSEIQEKFEHKNEINQQLFDALHKELKDYKDGFIIEVIQKPLVRDLITLYDDLAEVRRQMGAYAKSSESEKEATPQSTCEHLKNMGTNVDHVMLSLVEVMARMEVNLMEPSKGKLNKTTQRAVAVELADAEGEDGEIARSLKPGFTWRERIVRAEEVIIKKWKEGFLVALNNESNEGNDVQSGTTDAK